MGFMKHTKYMKLTNNYTQNLTILDQALFIPDSFDIVHRDMLIGGHRSAMYFIDGFAKDEILEKMNEFLLKLQPSDLDENLSVFERSNISYIEVSLNDDVDTLVTQLLSGTILLLIEGYAQCISIDARTYPARSIAEPEDDRVLRGSRDGFVETLVFNTALIRRRIRDPHLTMQIKQIGSKSKSDIVLCYLSNIVDPKLLKSLENQLTQINVQSLTLSQESLAECLIKKSWWNPFPRVRYTERCDCASANILEGKIIVIVDNSPAVMILPTSIFDFIQDTNDFYFPPVVGTYLRWVRFIVFASTLFLTPCWYLYTQNPELFPEALSFLLVKEMNTVPILVQLLIVELMVDAIKLASLNTPSSLSGSFGVIGALVLGEFAVKAHWFVPEVLLYMSFVSLANFTQPSYELGYALKLGRIFLLLMSGFFNLVGFGIGLLVLLIVVITTPTILPQHYLFPLFPFNWKRFKALLIRVPIDKENT